MFPISRSELCGNILTGFLPVERGQPILLIVAFLNYALLTASHYQLYPLLERQWTKPKIPLRFGAA